MYHQKYPFPKVDTHGQPVQYHWEQDSPVWPHQRHVEEIDISYSNYWNPRIHRIRKFSNTVVMTVVLNNPRSQRSWKPQEIKNKRVVALPRIDSPRKNHRLDCTGCPSVSSRPDVPRTNLTGTPVTRLELWRHRGTRCVNEILQSHLRLAGVSIPDTTTPSGVVKQGYPVPTSTLRLGPPSRVLTVSRPLLPHEVSGLSVPHSQGLSSHVWSLSRDPVLRDTSPLRPGTRPSYTVSGFKTVRYTSLLSMGHYHLVSTQNPGPPVRHRVTAEMRDSFTLRSRRICDPWSGQDTFIPQRRQGGPSVPPSRVGYEIKGPYALGRTKSTVPPSWRTDLVTCPRDP